MRWLPFLFRLLFLHSDSLLLGTKFSPTQTREVSMMLEERRVYLNRAGWVEWIHRWVPSVLFIFFHCSISINSFRISSANCLEVAVDSLVAVEAVANRALVGPRIWSIAYTSPLRTSIKERPPSSP